MGKPVRVLLCATHPRQYNGYSLCAVELAKVLAKNPDIELLYYGFQNFYNDNNNHRADFPTNVLVYDAFANESPRGAGFGFDQMKEFVRTHKPDVIILYNDLLVVSTFLKQLHEARNEGCKFKIIAYIDQVYLNQRKEYINIVNHVADVGMLFTKYWEDIILPQGLKLPTCYLPHGINTSVHFPVDRMLARRYYNLKPEDFLVLNLNRNQPRKRWDICMQAFAEVLVTHADKPIKLLIATAVQGAWHLLELFERELGKRGLTMQEGMKHIVLHDNPQRVTDEDINILYNASDIGINTCDGEGYGLCQFQQAACGVPQVVPDIGGFKEFFDKDCAIMVEPKMTYYVDCSRDAVCGEAQLCDYRDFAKGIITYYENAELRAEHGKRARERIVKGYQWADIGAKLSDICIATHLGNDVGKIVQRPASGVLSDMPDISQLSLQQQPSEIQETPKTKTKTKKKSAKGIKKIKSGEPKKISALKAQLDDMLSESV
jgi:glycosyltransferase involved in cell wall biosynthesis